MTEKRNVIIDGIPCSVTISDECEALSSAYAAGGAIIGIWDRSNPDRSLSPAEYLVESAGDADEELIERVARRRLGLPWIIAETKRLMIREFTVEDMENMAQGEREDRQATCGGGATKEDRITSDEEEIFRNRDTLSAYINCQYRFCEYGVWAIKEKRTGQIIGRAGLFSPDSFVRENVAADEIPRKNTSGKDAPDEDGPDKKEDIPLELGYHIFLPWRQNGFAREACTAILEYAAAHGMKRLCAVIDPDNTPSIRLAEALGFQFTAQTRSEAGQEKCLYVWSCS